MWSFVIFIILLFFIVFYFLCYLYLFYDIFTLPFIFFSARFALGQSQMLAINPICWLACGVLATDPEVSPPPKLKPSLSLSLSLERSPLNSTASSVFNRCCNSNRLVSISAKHFSQSVALLPLVSIKSNQIKVYLFGFAGAICLEGLFTHQPVWL